MRWIDPAEQLDELKKESCDQLRASENGILPEGCAKQCVYMDSGIGRVGNSSIQANDKARSLNSGDFKQN